jgi:hypothetical protein
MERQLDDGKVAAPADQQRPIDPLRRVFVPVKKRKSDGTIVLQTLDHTQYQRHADGSIRRIHPKVNGKLAKKLRRRSTHVIQTG